MPKSYFLPRTDAGIATTLVTFDNGINASSGALATKYTVTTAELNRVRAGRYMWEWFLEVAAIGSEWMQGMTGKRDLMVSGAQTGTVAVPGGPAMPANPTYIPLPTGPGPVAALLDPGFFEFFLALVARIKSANNYDPADGVLLGIEGTPVAPPTPSIVPVVTGDLFHSGHPGLTCKKGVFDGYTVWLTRPGQARREIGFSSHRHYDVLEALPAAGTAEIWTFEVQYRYKGAAFGQISQPLVLTVRGV